jgi:hypothetical protein
VLLAVVVGATVAGVAAGLAMDRVAVSAAARRRVGTILLAGAALVPLAGLVALAVSSRGLFGQISNAWQSVTNPNSVVFDNASRITQLGSSRPLYWDEGLKVGAHALLKGAGELGYGVARLLYTTNPAKADQAHSYVVQTFADLGLVGVALTLGLLVAWGRAAARALVPRAPWRSLTAGRADERAGLLALAIVVIVFGIQSCLDFTFYFTGVTVPVLLCAGWLAGRGPLGERVGRRAGRVSVLDRPGAGALVTALATLALVGAWLQWQPLRSAQAMNDAVEHPATAFASARAAVSRDPLSIQPLYLLSTLYTGAGDASAARAQLVTATRLQPENPRTWLWLGTLDYKLGQLTRTIPEMKHVLALDHAPDSITLPAVTILGQATTLLNAQRAAAAPVSSRKRARPRAGSRARTRGGRPRKPR